MTKRRPYRRDGKGIHADEARLRAAGLGITATIAHVGGHARGVHDLWSPYCVQQRHDGQQGPLCLGCDILCDAIRRNAKPSGK